MTDATGHTPGKWTTRERQGGRIDVIHEYATPDRGPGEEVAGVAIVSWAGTAEQTDANARLIALAPEMETLLRGLWRAFTGTYSTRLAYLDATDALMMRIGTLLSSLDQEEVRGAS